MKYENPNNWDSGNIVTVRKNDLVEVWIPPVDNPEGELVARLHSDWIPTLIHSLKRFEQKEGRKT